LCTFPEPGRAYEASVEEAKRVGVGNAIREVARVGGLERLRIQHWRVSTRRLGI